MTALMTAVKAQLLCVDHNLKFSFQFNPSSLSLSRSVNWGGSPSKKKDAGSKKKGADPKKDEAVEDPDISDEQDGEMGTAWPALGAAKGELDELDFETLFDESEDHALAQLSAASLLSSFASLIPALPALASMLQANTKSVVTNIEALYQLTLPVKFEDTEIRPPVLSFKWGDFEFTGVMASVDFEILQFDMLGKAKRAKVKCRMKGRFGSSALRKDVLVAPDPAEYGSASSPLPASPLGETIMA
jgi:Contractile injection system tube protein